MPSVPFSSSEHKWYLHGKLEQPPEISQDGQTVTVTTVKGTDWWHVPDAWRSTGPIYGFDVDLPEKGVDLKVSVELDVAYKLEVDQACLIIRFDDSHWLKTGVEFSNHRIWQSAVVTSPWSDWSLVPVSAGETPPPTRFAIHVTDEAVKIYRGDDVIREVMAFGIDLDASKKRKLQVGVMACSPLGDPVKATFKDFQIEDKSA